MEENREISPIIYSAIKRLKNSFGGTDIKLLSEKMYRIKPDEHTPLGKLGVDIEIMGVKTFLGCESMAEDIVWSPYGQMIADDMVARAFKETPIYNIVKKHNIEENKIEIGHDITATDTYFLVTALLDKLGIKYEESGEETICIKYWIERKESGI